ncbi:MAG: hypothetical protein K2W82_16895 [Candidatus Obscuribacterales bacterium]|nr:hypothetical protein [Candidatus Obscuribacterales bacterium]
MLHEAHDEFGFDIEAALALALELDPELKYDQSMFYDEDDLLAEWHAYQYDLVEEEIANAWRIHDEWSARKTPRKGFILPGQNGKMKVLRGGHYGRIQKTLRPKLAQSVYRRLYWGHPLDENDLYAVDEGVTIQPEVEDKPTEILCGRDIVATAVYDERGHMQKASCGRVRDYFIFEASSDPLPAPKSKKSRRNLRRKQRAGKNERREQQKRSSSYSTTVRERRRFAAQRLHQLEQSFGHALNKEEIKKLQKEFAGRTPKCNRKKRRKL